MNSTSMISVALASMESVRRQKRAKRQEIKNSLLAFPYKVFLFTA
jgi:hypothetical protein